MASQPVKLDMSTFQPLTVPIPKGPTIGVPIPKGATIGAPSQQNGNVALDFSKAQPLDMSTYQSLDPTPKGFWASVGARLQSPISAGPMGQGDQQPQAKASGPVTDNAWDQQKQVLKDSFNEMVDNVTHPSQLLHMLPGWDQIKDKITPKQIQQWQQGDKSGAAGTTLVDIGNLITGGASAAAPEAFGAPVTSAANAAVRGTAKATNAILHNAPDVIPSAFVPPIVKKIASRVIVPGEDFGVVEPPPYDAAAVEARTTATKARQQAAQDLSGIPENPTQAPVQPARQAASTVPTAAERQAYLDQIAAKRQAMGLTKPVAGEATPATPALPSEDDVAKGMGYRNAMQAQQHLGPDRWQATYQKIANSPGVEGAPTASAPSVMPAEPVQPSAAKPSTPDDVVDAAVPASANKALNMKTKAEVDFYVQKGDVEGAKAAIQRAASAMDSMEKPQIRAFQPAKLTDAQWAEKWDDRAVRDQIEAREGTDAVSTRNPNWKNPDSMQALISDATRRKVPTSSLGRMLLGEQDIPLPGTPKGELAKQMQMPGGTSLSDEDLTELLQKSVDAAKAAKNSKRPLLKQP